MKNLEESVNYYIRNEHRPDRTCESAYNHTNVKFSYNDNVNIKNMKDSCLITSIGSMVKKEK